MKLSGLVDISVKIRGGVTKLLLFFSFFMLTGRVNAQGDAFKPPDDSPPPNLETLFDWIGTFFKRALTFTFPIAVLVASGVIVYGGYMWMVSTGDPAKIKQAQGTLTWGVIGLVFLGLIGMILQVFFDFFFN